MIVSVRHLTYITTLCFLIGLTHSADAQELDTLKRIKETETITIGYRDIASPFSYLNEKKQPIGYSIDLCLKIVDAIRVQRQMPRLDIKWKLVTGASRIPLVANGTVDIECGSTTNSIEREQQVAFADTTYVASTRLAYKKDSHIKSLKDLSGKLVVAVAGTTNLKEINDVNAKRHLQMKIAPVKDNAKAFAMVQNGEAAAFGTDDILLYDLIANAASPNDYDVSKQPLSIEPYGIMLRKNDPEFKKLADATITDLFKSGEIKKIYGKWFLSPIPPNNIVLNIPISDALNRAFMQPTDSPLPSDYSEDDFFKVD